MQLVKLDYQLNAANHISAVANNRDWKEPNGTPFATTNNSGLTTTGTTFIQDRFVIATLTTLIGTNKVNEVRYQWGVDKPVCHLVRNRATGRSRQPGYLRPTRPHPYLQRRVP